VTQHRVEGYGPVSDPRRLDPAAYGQAFADVYDEWYGPDSDHPVSDIEGTVAAVAAEARRLSGPVLELGIGTGRIALPLAAAGAEVHGIDASPAMVAKLRAKPGGTDIAVVEGDFGRVLPPVDGGYAVVLAAFNTLLNLTDPGALERCLRSAHDVLMPGGALVVEAIVPGDAAATSGVDVRSVDEAGVVLSVFTTEGDVVTGSVVSIATTGITLRPWAIRTVGPTELDTLATAAGLALERRDGGWRGEPFTDETARYVAWYRRPARTISG
jgi:SAM-dependent methyltransferase